ncbi:uncharacterized protein LOC115634538 [Scaptodrosophila lebanonensis]|uniref:Uncharacterized protein LOC115634538 n=1 Tax=Drosophila lebanonensis TaxID=7225 RepID=A0A6J2UL86_DROLE|nr:uncharacterized protein LOC115634538 [Scaptodrosophila lebanonensis]
MAALQRCLPSPRLFNFCRYISCISRFPDVPCMPKNPFCHHVEDSCEMARSVLMREVPDNRYLSEMQQLEKKCCVARVFQANPCYCKPHKRKKRKKPYVPFRSMWEPPCRPNTQPHCPELLPRFDDLYYKTSDKCRSFQRTWNECPAVHTRLRKVCCLDAIRPPEVIYRWESGCPSTACEQDKERLKHICNWQRKDSVCQRILARCCDLGRCPPSCKPKRRITQCSKLKAPFPAYSETNKRWQRPLQDKECTCHRYRFQCEVFREQHRQAIRGI